MSERRTLTVKTRRPSTPDQVSMAAEAVSKSGDSRACDSGELRHELIAVQAYLLAEARGFAPGGELEDWLTAEALVDARLRAAAVTQSRGRRR